MDLNDLESMDLSADVAPLESVEPFVLACLLALGPDAGRTRGEAVARIRLLAKHRSDIRELFGVSGAIPALVPLLQSTNPVAQESAVTALLNLSLKDFTSSRVPTTLAAKLHRCRLRWRCSPGPRASSGSPLFLACYRKPMLLWLTLRCSRSVAPQVCGLGPMAVKRRLSTAEAFAACEGSLLRPLPGLDLPPCLPDNLSRSPTRITMLPNGLRVATEDVPVTRSTQPLNRPKIPSLSPVVQCILFFSSAD